MKLIMIKDLFKCFVIRWILVPKSFLILLPSKINIHIRIIGILKPVGSILHNLPNNCSIITWPNEILNIPWTTFRSVVFKGTLLISKWKTWLFVIDFPLIYLDSFIKLVFLVLLLLYRLRLKGWISAVKEDLLDILSRLFYYSFIIISMTDLFIFI